MTARPTVPFVAAGAFTLAAYFAAGLAVAPALGSGLHPAGLRAALVVDLVVLVPLALAAALRARGWPVWWALPVAAPGAAAAWAALADRLPAVGAPTMLLAAEVAGLGTLVVVAVRLARRRPASDPYDQLAEAGRVVLGDSGVARALAYEAAVVWYALGPLPTPPAGAFPARRSSGWGSIVAGLAVAGALELVGGHVLVRHAWGDGAALVHLLASAYALVWLWGDWRALGSRVTTLDGDTLRIRCGLRWSADVPVGLIEAVYHVRRDLPDDRPAVSAVPFGRPRFAIDLREPVTVTGAYGVQRRVTRVAIGTDDPERFLDEIARAMARP